MNTYNSGPVIGDYFRYRELAVFWARVALDVARQGHPYQEVARRAHEAFRYALLNS